MYFSDIQWSSDRFTPIAANTIAKLSSWSSKTLLPGSLTRPPCRQIWAAIWGRNQTCIHKLQTPAFRLLWNQLKDIYTKRDKSCIIFLVSEKMHQKWYSWKSISQSKQNKSIYWKKQMPLHVRQKTWFEKISYFIVRETSCWEDGNLLSSSDAVHGVYGRDTGLDHFLRVDPRPGVNRLTCNLYAELSTQSIREKNQSGQSMSSQSAPLHSLMLVQNLPWMSR